LIPLAAPLLLGALLFSVGVYGVLARRHGVLLLMAIELIINAANLNLIAYAQRWSTVADGTRAISAVDGNIVALFIIAITAAEVGVGLAIVLMIYRRRSTVSVDELQLMKW
jgi:NADH:ubiquinone oxidoreductase subunit K